MRFLFEAGKKRRVMHITGHDTLTGDPTFEPLCDINLPLNRTINVPMGRGVCKNCLRRYYGDK